MLLFVRSKPIAIAAATLILMGWGVVAGVATADPPGQPPAPPGPPGQPAPPGAAAPPELKTVIDHDGTFMVGTDIAPGTYSSAGPVDGRTCYWKRLSSPNSSDIIDNAMTKKPQVVQIDPTDKAFKTDGCQPWQKTDAAKADVKTPADMPALSAQAQLQMNLLLAIANQHRGDPPSPP
jgi:hypothetical protein